MQALEERRSGQATSVAPGLLAAVGLAAVPVVLWSELTLKSTGGPSLSCRYSSAGFRLLAVRSPACGCPAAQLHFHFICGSAALRLIHLFIDAIMGKLEDAGL